MPLYMSQFSYKPEAMANMIKNPETRSSVFHNQNGINPKLVYIIPI